MVAETFGVSEENNNLHHQSWLFVCASAFITCTITTSCTLLPCELPSVDLMVAFQCGSTSSLAQLRVQHAREQRQHRSEANQERKCQKQAGSRDACDCVTTKFTLGISATPHRDLRNMETDAQLCSIQIMMVKFLFTAVNTAVNTAVTHYTSRGSNSDWSQYNAPPLCHSYNGIRCAVEHTM